jgi:hypothetical protein
MVTHEIEMTEYASRIVHFIDGKIVDEAQPQKVAT